MNQEALRKKKVLRSMLAYAKTKEAYEWRHEPVFFYGSLEDIHRRMLDECVLEDDGCYHYYGRKNSDISLTTV